MLEKCLLLHRQRKATGTKEREESKHTSYKKGQIRTIEWMTIEK